MTSAQSREFAEQLLQHALQAGAEDAEVFQSVSMARPVYFEANRLKQLDRSQVEGTALRLWRDGRPGLAVAHGHIDPTVLVDRALALSDLNDPETIELTSNMRMRHPDEGMAMSGEALVAMGNTAIAQIRAAYPEVICMVELDCDVETTRIINTRGLDCEHTDTTLNCFIEAEWIRGDDFLNVSDGQTRRRSLDLDELVEQILQRLTWATDTATVHQRRVPVLFTAKAADMLWGTLQSVLSGKRVLERSSPWSDRLEKQVLAPALTLYQDPQAGPYSCPFDDEGIPTRKLTFIQEGVLKLFYTDRTTGRLLGGGSTGNGFRPSLGSYPTPGCFNCLVQPGTRSLPELISSLESGLIVDQMLGGGAGISGDFSVNVDLGYWVEGGEITGRVKDTMVAGNVYTALKHDVELGSDADWNGACYTPSIVVNTLSVTGAG